MIFKEDLLQYIWEHYKFDDKDLITTCGKKISIKNRGLRNFDQGPDFIDARIVLDKTEWAGNIELHLTTKEWMHHGHSQDPNYKNVILHVVWKNNDSLFTQSPVLELQHLIDNNFLTTYQILMQNHSMIPCTSIGGFSINNEIKEWIDDLGLTRLIEKSDGLIQDLNQLKGNWEELIWRTISRNFGHRVNAEGFYQLATSIPFYLIKKYKQHVFDLEAMMMGQAGLLQKNWQDEYPKKLLDEYYRIKKLHNLKEINYPIYFLRMRPANFPTIRLAQLASLLSQNTSILDMLKEIENADQFKKIISFDISEYWVNHYRFDKISTPTDKKPGNTFLDNLIINSFTPLLYAYGCVIGSTQYKEKAKRWFRELSVESNSILVGFNKIGLKPTTAAESQSLLALHKKYCTQKKCTDCKIGRKILQDAKSLKNELSPVIIDI
jgi:hypothetical protein